MRLTLNRPRLLIRFLCCAVLLPAPSSAFDFVVTRYDDPAPDGCLATDCSLREAVIAANADTDADRILLSSGTYRLTIAGTGESLAADGDLDVRRDVEILGVGSGLTILDSAGTGETTLSASLAGLDFVLRRLTIQNSDDDGLHLGIGNHLVEEIESRDNGSVSFGVGIETTVGSVAELRRITASGNSGIGLRVTQGSAIVENCTLSGNDSSELTVNFAVSFVATHCTITGATDANHEVTSHDSVVRLANSIVVGSCNFTGGATLDSLGGNIESAATTCQLDHPSDLAPVSLASLGLGPLADNGGGQRTHLPALGSIAQGAAFDALCLPSDQRGVPRPGDCESGAVELTNARVPTAIFIDGFLQGSPAAWTALVP